MACRWQQYGRRLAPTAVPIYILAVLGPQWFASMLQAACSPPDSRSCFYFPYWHGRSESKSLRTRPFRPYRFHLRSGTITWRELRGSAWPKKRQASAHYQQPILHGCSAAFARRIAFHGTRHLPCSSLHRPIRWRHCKRRAVIMASGLARRTLAPSIGQRCHSH